ncbi:hypothetical protein MF271_05055 [Deinococcus sp. KNUC1210]|uniref:hypothetical protein n=1 Tax=Deinococcus sp. KNUC1210 TaxID=2917691 RepID=UPI001EEF90FE|nr:hypothetical protein [Deinococcus sp. KNUC1210]ULH16004.1 hypothetical protein MF271_05055 [Deinococcus sp. KNUC1210]
MSQFILWSAVAYVIFAIADRLLTLQTLGRSPSSGALVAIILIGGPIVVYTRWIQSVALGSRPPELKIAARGFSAWLVVAQIGLGLSMLTPLAILFLPNRDLDQPTGLDVLINIVGVIFYIVMLLMVSTVGRWVILTTEGKTFKGNARFSVLTRLFFVVGSLLILTSLLSEIQLKLPLIDLVITELRLVATLALGWATQRFMEQSILQQGQGQ